MSWNRGRFGRGFRISGRDCPGPGAGPRDRVRAGLNHASPWQGKNPAEQPTFAKRTEKAASRPARRISPMAGAGSRSGPIPRPVEPCGASDHGGLTRTPYCVPVFPPYSPAFPYSSVFAIRRIPVPGHEATGFLSGPAPGRPSRGLEGAGREEIVRGARKWLRKRLFFGIARSAGAGRAV